MNQEIFSNISKIIERDSKSTTYKFALLRGTIDIIQENSPFLNFIDGKVFIPMGLLIEKWMIYYYPIFESETLIPQINGNSKLAFASQMYDLVSFYRKLGGLSVFYNDLKRNNIPEEINSLVTKLAKTLNQTLRNMPMKYLGGSISTDFHSIFKPESKANRIAGKVDSEYLIQNFGTYSIPMDYYQVFRLLGSFISGQDSILFKWAEFSVKASSQTSQLNIQQVVENVLKSPVTERDSKDSKIIYNEILKSEGETHCVWTGNKVQKIEVDHVIPFAVWKNNDLWNLLPSNPKTNNSKRDKIPSPALIENQKDIILHYWGIVDSRLNSRFQKEIRVSLLGDNQLRDWKEVAIDQLKSTCTFLIEKRGFEKWEI